MVTVLHTQLDLVRDYVNTLDFETGIDTIASPDELATCCAPGESAESRPGWKCSPALS